MSNDYYVYIYRNPLRNNEPFYVGKGKGTRKYSHLYETETSTRNRLKYNLIQKIKRETGQNPPIEMHYENLSNEDALWLEEQMIAFFGRRDLGKGPLTNLTDGGEPGRSKESFTEKELQSIRVRMSQPHSETHKINQGLAKRNKIVAKDTQGRIFSVDSTDPRWLSGELVGVSKGTTLSEDTKAKMKKVHTGKKWFNDGHTETFAHECPDGFNKGRLKHDTDQRGRFRTRRQIDGEAADTFRAVNYLCSISV